MGYSVHEDRSGGRWAGYGVPAECDWISCSEKIDRGMAYKCEEHGPDVDGCGLFFCYEHRKAPGHDTMATPKPDTDEWVRHMLTDPSWRQWRDLHAPRVAVLAGMLAAAASPPKHG